jgi:hypothetical protein
MRTVLGAILLLLALPVLAAGPIPGELSCAKGVNIQRVQALVKRTTTALRSDQDRVIREINRGNGQWKDGNYYVFVGQGTRIIAHALFPAWVNRDFGTLPWINALQRMAMERGEGCVEYVVPNPAKGGQLERNVGYAVNVDGAIWAGSGTFLILN